MSVTTLNRNKKYLEELSLSDLTPDEIGKKRAELYLELSEAGEEARGLFEKYKEEDKPISARSFFMSWMEVIQLKMKLYGLDSVKIDSFTQINQQFNMNEPDLIDKEIGDRLAKALKEGHERKLRNVS